MKKSTKLIILLFILSGLIGVLAGVYVYIYLPNVTTDTLADVATTENTSNIYDIDTEESTTEEMAPINITITGIGDIMMHKWQMERGYNSATDTFELSDTFTYITPYLEESTYTVGNLETVFAGKNNGALTNVHGYSCFPNFNAPESFAVDIKNAGVDLVGTANNHSLDSYIKGVYTSLDFLEKAGLEHVGTARSEEEKNTLTIVDIDGINVGFVNYTYDLNGYTLPSNQQYAVNTLLNYNSDKVSEMSDEIKALKDNGADIVVALLHLGVEYQSSTNSYQEEVINKAVDSGADIIFGSHPHVIEPMEIRKKTDENGNEKNVVIFYSLGNFVSSQIYRDGIMKDIGLIADVDIIKDELGTRVEGVRVSPCYTYWNSEVIGVVPVIEAYENRDQYNFLQAKDFTRIEDAYNKTINTVTSNGQITYTIIDNKYEINLD